MSQLDTTSFADDLISIVLSGLDDLRLSHLEVVRFQIRSGVEGVPAMVSLRRQLTMPSPIIPRPMKPIFVMMMFVDGYIVIERIAVCLIDDCDEYYGRLDVAMEFIFIYYAMVMSDDG